MNSPLIIDLYEGILSRKMKKFPSGFWKEPEHKEVAALLTRHLLEERLKWDKNTIKKQVSQTTFNKHKLSGMLAIVFKGSVWDVINNAYPNEFKPWELLRVPKNYWEGDVGIANGIAATRWLIEDVLNWDCERVKKEISIYHFKKHRLIGMLRHVFSDSPFNALNAAYPNTILPWELPNAPISLWKDKENARRATRWLINRKLGGLTNNTLRVSYTHFEQHGLTGMLQHVYNNSPTKAVLDAFPEMMPWQCTSVSNGFWNSEENVVTALRWLFINKLELTSPDQLQTVKRRDFDTSGLRGLIQGRFQSSPKKAIQYAKVHIKEF